MPITLNHDGDIAVTNGTITVDGSPIGGGGGLSGTQYIYVAANGTDTQNATELQAAYDAAKLLSPTATNRITIVAGPGNYNFGSSTFTMDTQYIDLVSLDGNRSVVFNAALNTGARSEGSISITANDVFVKGIDVQTKAFTLADNLNLLRIENCKGGDESFGGYMYRTSGTFIDCIGGTDSWSTLSSGTYINCVGGGNCFGSGTSATGVFRNCVAGNFSFGNAGSNTSGTFTNCTGGNFSFGGNAIVASGTFTNCTGGQGSFGGGSFTATVASGTFTNCTGGQGSFGGGDGTITVASGTFTNCTGGNESFGGGTGILTGKLFYCRLTSGTFSAVSSGGITRLCLDGNNVENNQG